MVIKPTYEIDGHVFTLKKTSPKNRRELSEFLAKVSDEIDDIDESKIESLEDVYAQYDEIKKLFDCFCLITEGPHELLVYDEWDAKVGEQALTDFFPQGTLTMMRQISYLGL